MKQFMFYFISCLKAHFRFSLTTLIANLTLTQGILEECIIFQTKEFQVLDFGKSLKERMSIRNANICFLDRD